MSASGEKEPGPTSKLLGLIGGEGDSEQAVVISSAPIADPLEESFLSPWVWREPNGLR